MPFTGMERLLCQKIFHFRAPVSRVQILAAKSQIISSGEIFDFLQLNPPPLYFFAKISFHFISHPPPSLHICLAFQLKALNSKPNNKRAIFVPTYLPT